MKRLSRIPFCILLAAIYPVLVLLAENIGQVRLDAASRPMLASILGGFLFYGAMWLLVRDPHKAGLLSIGAMLLFFSYGHVYELIEGITILGINIGRHRMLFPIWAILAFVGTWIILRMRSTTWAPRLMIPLIIAVVIPIAGITVFEAQSWSDQRRREINIVELGLVGSIAKPEGSLPDIYYIILDGYARHDVMLDTYGFDDRYFLSDLEERGFVIASCSQSNYNHTDLSLASSLNFAYLDELNGNDESLSTNRTWVPPLIRTSQVRGILDDMGYEFIAFETGFPFTEITDADIYLVPSSYSRSLLSGISGFESLFLRSTAASFLLDGIGSISDRAVPLLDGSDDWHRNHVLFAFESLEEIASRRGPKFVFAHVVSPHEPFVLGQNGDFVQSPPRVNDEYSAAHLDAYADQAEYIASRTIEVIDVLLSTTGSQPVVIVQADHGPDLGSREDNLKILNAYRFPGAAEDVYPSITPVNTFRLVLNSILDTELALEDDRSYYSSKELPLELKELQSECTN